MISFLTDLFTNKVFVSAGSGWFIAQLVKVIIDSIRDGFSVKRLVGGGGMPSTHSSLVTGLFISTGIVYGVSSFEFVIAFFFAMVVMYDAMGVRLTTGKEAYILNKLRERDLAENKEPLYDKNLDEKMGHTFPEIVAGVITGTICALVVCLVIL